MKKDDKSFELKGSNSIENLKKCHSNNNIKKKYNSKNENSSSTKNKSMSKIKLKNLPTDDQN